VEFTLGGVYGDKRNIFEIFSFVKIVEYRGHLLMTSNSLDGGGLKQDWGF
jgi:hypothetical protein